MKDSKESRFDPVRALRPYHHVRYEAPCNLRCFYCYEQLHGRSASDLTPDFINESLVTARKAGYGVAVFGAGELLMLPFWEQSVRFAQRLGFEEIVLVTNLVLIDQTGLERLCQAGVTGITGTLFALNDADAAAVSGGKGVFSRQRNSIGLIARRGGLSFRVHLMLTRGLSKDLMKEVCTLRETLGVACETLMVSAIEPVSESVVAHPCYTDGLDIPWEDVFRKADEEGVTLVVQNVPACMLGRYAHRSYVTRKRVARILEGWPGDAQLVRWVNEKESLYGRVEPSGPCTDCPVLSVCHRFFDYCKKREVKNMTDHDVVQRLFAEEGVEVEVEGVIQALRRIESRTAPDDTVPGAGPDAAIPCRGL